MTVAQHESTRVRQKQIITAAKKLIVKHGSEHVTVRRMAHEIGISEGAIYRHFVSKKEILSVLLDDAEQTFLADLDGYQNGNQFALVILQDMLMHQFADIKDKKGVAFQIIAEIISLGDRELNQKAQRVIQSFVYRIQEILAKGVQAGTIRADLDLPAVSILLFSMIQGMATMWTLDHYNIDLEQKYRYLWEMFKQHCCYPVPALTSDKID